jgi:ribosome-binding protein aMBF1 (putative translation factor)
VTALSKINTSKINLSAPAGGRRKDPNVVQTRFGDQPLSEEMRRQRWHYSGLAREISVTQKQLYAAARGIVVPSPVLRDKLPAILGVPLSQLFTAEALDYRYQDNHHRFDRPSGNREQRSRHERTHP